MLLRSSTLLLRLPKSVSRAAGKLAASLSRKGFDMIKVKLLVSRVGADGPQNRGDVIEVPAATAERMVAGGQAEMVRAQKPETTSKRGKSAEKASKG